MTPYCKMLLKCQVNYLVQLKSYQTDFLQTNRPIELNKECNVHLYLIKRQCNANKTNFDFEYHHMNICFIYLCFIPGVSKIPKYVTFFIENI